MTLEGQKFCLGDRKQMITLIVLTSISLRGTEQEELRSGNKPQRCWAGGSLLLSVTAIYVAPDRRCRMLKYNPDAENLFIIMTDVPSCLQYSVIFSSRRGESEAKVIE
ncbi:hypothetical protein ILYODFUR_022463, partial [Ilyodon furcidens]